MTTNGLQAYHQWAAVPLIERPRYSVVVAVGNETWRVNAAVRSIAIHMSSLRQPWELIVADHGSTDETASVIADLQLTNLHLLAQRRSEGKGAAVRRGVLAARGELILLADAKQTVPIEHFELLLQKIDHGAEVVVGSRTTAETVFAGESEVRPNMSQGFAFAVTAGFKLPMADTQCGFKLLTAESAHLLFSRQLMNDASFEMEVLFLARKFGLAVSQVPVTVPGAAESKFAAVKATAKLLTDLVSIRRNDLNDRYTRENHKLELQDLIHDEPVSREAQGYRRLNQALAAVGPARIVESASASNQTVERASDKRVKATV